MNYITQIDDYFNVLKATIDKIDKDEIKKAIICLKNARDSRHFIYSMGNGGSAATASHYAGDFNKGLSFGKEKRFKFVALNDNLPTILSLANDVSYTSIFIEQLKNFLEPQDVVIAISGSGNSENIINAVQYAKEHGGIVIGLTGHNGGKLKELSDIKLHVPINNMQIVEDLHMVFDHLMMSILYRGEETKEHSAYRS
jgi:D-sedoheptulose 7-phosphate isomerase